MAYYIKQNLPLAKRTRKGNLSEVDLFRQMMAVFKICYGATVIVSETHRNYVGFSTTDLATKQNIPNKTREISDLHIITYSPSMRIARETYLQAKVTSNSLDNGSLQFDGDWYQYDLLSRRPIVQKPLKKPLYWRAIYNPQFLNEAILPSMGSYGIFYETGHNNINFAYQPANHLVPSGSGKGYRTFKINGKVPKYGSMPGIPDLQYTCDVDDFEYAVTHNLIGSPIQARDLWPFFPYWHHYLMRREFLAYSNSQMLIEEVMDGLREFYSFILSNLELFERDNQENINHNERYQSLWRYTEHENTSSDDEYGGLLEPNISNALCRGAESIILLNTDNILERERMR